MIMGISAEVNFYKYKRKLFQYFSNVCNYSLQKKTLKILFFGTDNFSLPSLKILHNASLDKSNVSSVSVVTSFKSPANCIRVYAETSKIPLYKWPIDSQICRQYDLGVVVSFGHMIPENIIQSFPLGMINVHASILPRWRGAAPIIYSLMKGDKKTGVSIMKIEPKKFDVGDIYAQKEVDVGPHVLLPQLHGMLAEDGASLLMSTIEGYPNTFKSPKIQDSRQATYAPKIVPNVAVVDWNSMTALEVYNLYRALYGFKHLTTKLNSLNLRLINIQIGPELKSGQGPPGSVEIIRSAKCLRVRCKANTSIDIFQLKVEGKRNMTAVEFTNGFIKQIETNLILY